MSEKYWGKGIGSEAVGLLIEHLLSDEFTNQNQNQKIERIHATVFPENIQSERVLIKNGFEYEGLVKKGVRKGDQLRDLKSYARMRL
jgi:[ribosomal protein S5]-alanine N-acetyltransferase